MWLPRSLRTALLLLALLGSLTWESCHQPHGKATVDVLATSPADSQPWPPIINVSSGSNHHVDEWGFKDSNPQPLSCSRGAMWRRDVLSPPRTSQTAGLWATKCCFEPSSLRVVCYTAKTSPPPPPLSVMLARVTQISFMTENVPEETGSTKCMSWPRWMHEDKVLGLNKAST